MEIRNLTKKMDDNLVLKDVSFDLKAGEVTALIGRNGVGKTTLFSTMTGIYLPDEGDVFLDEKSIFKHPEVKQQLFFLEDNMNHFNTYSVHTVVKIYKQIYTTFDETFFMELMEQFELPMKAKLLSFSKGRKALFFIILAFSLNVRYLLLDEPMDGLDIIVKKQILAIIKDTVKKRGTSVVIASHRLEELEAIADRVIVLKGASVELDYYLDDMRTDAVKIQVAFKTKKIPDFVKNNAQLLYRNGRIYTLLVTENASGFLADLRLEEPVLLEEMSISIEDIFTVHLANDKIDYYEI
ncbi:ABC transporter ATP-binding protein [Listeria cossartiae subsp. cayugensis]|uniref:ABC transporter ATP-binding protein n=1 Tax=Listeria cossartiae TaxID=2838249 RepID=UPI002880A46E|nr:ABC transporter ATP-binding protein [Listeria cossartiae]MDT0004014.1 ABC transporter ATP-binding protein [Listeria cossartiae subsp. cayugensis]MDT0020408.1 ABC transporter ATP-binding protein [Listeria cossartiae subsp. cayugensis]MDT0036377.1 ABC transporter ATP-binding protein [Listeria cossartiae subsp. cayugensis]MDT0042159.1 ABC transporter ATP-binding protein [Listeria cossartiae subsp. cayugensis]MDT0047510.1 ABC transporter ATP-binding protein [Listeria cossartiae subsp. cayugensi